MYEGLGGKRSVISFHPRAARAGGCSVTATPALDGNDLVKGACRADVGDPGCHLGRPRLKLGLQDHLFMSY